MMKTFRLFGLVALSLVLFGCQPGSNDNNDPEPPANVQHGNIGDVICINGYYYKITNNFNPYTVELEKEGYTASSSAAPKRVASQNNADSPYEGEVVIPSVVTYDGAEFAVTAIGESAFYNKNVKSVYIPGCVEKVGLNGPLAESRKRAICTFSEAVRLCKIEMTDPDRFFYWQNRYVQYRKAANKHVARANTKFIGTTSDKFYSTLRGFIIASLSAKLRANISK